MLPLPVLDTEAVHSPICQCLYPLYLPTLEMRIPSVVELTTCIAVYQYPPVYLLYDLYHQ